MKPLLTALLLMQLLITHAQDHKTFPMWNPSLPLHSRIDDVISRLTLEEKVAQMLNSTPAIERLGIPAYDWWNEVLHGVGRTPFRTTVFPQAIGMAATWDTTSLHQMADYSALEGRAIHNKAIQLGRTAERYMGLTYWTPNINIFRDPRWGRGQETYGEDPFLTACLGRAFVRGLQGEDPKYLKAAACAKHYAVHSGPEPSRHADNFNPSVYDLWDTYLPAFKTLITEANVAGVMCAYNAVEGQPCCANDQLMNRILRRDWNFQGYVTSDCWAVDDFYKYHKTHKDAQSSAVDAVLHGTDLECGQTVYKTLLDAVKTKQIPESQLDVSLRRLFEVRFRLGMFDPLSMVSYAQTPADVLESAAHQAHALKMAQQSIVLLKNERNTLPLSKQIKRIAIVGPNADNHISVLGNYNGIPSRIATVVDGIRAKLGEDVELIYEQGINFTNDTLLVYTDQQRLFHDKGSQGFRAEYFSNRELRGDPVVTRTERVIANAWQRGDTITAQLTATNFSARYSSVYHASSDGSITIEIDADDGYRLFINNEKVIDAWERNRWGAKTYRLNTRKDSAYAIKLEYWQGDDQAHVYLRTGHFERTDFAALSKRLSTADAIVFVGGISPQLEGEEMPVNAPGFNGGDRTSIALPAVQTRLLQALQATGKPVVFVMMTGSAIAIPWEAEDIPAIVNAWYGGQSAGTAVADVLFGDYNPAGRLPVTFYKSDKDLPGFSDYSMEGRTYRYFSGKALYPFGYGLSYTTFQYSGLRMPANLKRGGDLVVSCRVTNTGKRDGEEVVQVYASISVAAGKAPIRSLVGFKRIMLKAGASQNVSFTIRPEQLSLVDEKTGERYQSAGKLMLSVGGGQPDGTGKVLTGSVLVN